jgi:hypothetical protein
LIVNTNAVLTFAPSCQCFKAITRRRSEIAEFHRIVEHLQLALRDLRNASESSRVPAFVERFGICAPERTNRHWIKCITQSVKRQAISELGMQEDGAEKAGPDSARFSSTVGADCGRELCPVSSVTN